MIPFKSVGELICVELLVCIRVCRIGALERLNLGRKKKVTQLKSCVLKLVVFLNSLPTYTDNNCFFGSLPPRTPPPVPSAFPSLQCESSWYFECFASNGLQYYTFNRVYFATARKKLEVTLKWKVHLIWFWRKINEANMSRGKCCKLQILNWRKPGKQ